MNHNEPEESNEIARRLNVPLTEEESEKLKKLAKQQERSEGKTAQRLIREGLKRAEDAGEI